MAGMACNLHRSGRLCRWLIVLFDFSARVMNRIFGGEGGGVRDSNELTPEDPVTLFDRRAKSCQPLEYKIPPMNPNERVPR